MTQRLAKTRPSPPSPAPWSPQKPPRERFVPTWYADHGQSVHGHSHRISTMAKGIASGEFRLPRFQRPWRWSDADIIALLDGFLGGYFTGNLLLWERYDLPASTERFGEIEITSPVGSAMLVVDGQQRLGAIASAVLGGRFYFHLLDGTFSTDGPGPWRCPVGHIVDFNGERIDWFEEHAAEHGLPLDRVRDAWIHAVSAMDHVEIASTVFGWKWSIDRVIESYRRLNTTGVRMSPEDLEAGLRRAVEP